MFVHPLENTFASQPERQISDEAEHNHTKMSLRKNAIAKKSTIADLSAYKIFK
jgi:hypothetical protein